MTAKRRHSVHDRERAVLASDRCELLDRVAHASRRFRVHHADDVGALVAKLVAKLLWIDRSPPLDLDASNRGAIPLENLCEPVTKVAGDDHYAAHAVGDKVGDG